MSFRQCVLLTFCVAMVGCGGQRAPSEAEIKAANEKMAKDMATMKVPAKIERPGDPMKGMMMPPASPGAKR